MYLKDLVKDIDYSTKYEDFSINVDRKDIEKLNLVIDELNTNEKILEVIFDLCTFNSPSEAVLKIKEMIISIQENR